MRIRAIRTSISQGMVIMAKSFNPTQTRIIRKNISEKSTTKPETLSKHYHPPTTTYPMRRARASTVQILRRTPSLTTTRLYLWSRTVPTSSPTSTTRIATSVWWMSLNSTSRGNICHHITTGAMCRNSRTWPTLSPPRSTWAECRQRKPRTSMTNLGRAKQDINRFSSIRWTCQGFLPLTR